MEARNASHAGKSGGVALAIVVWLIAAAGILFASKIWLPQLASEHGAGIDRMFRYLFVTVGSLFVIGHLVLGYFILRFSRQEKISFRLASWKTERKWALIPAVVMALVAEGGILILGLPVWGKVYGSSAPQNAVTIEVTAEQFAWNVRYPGKDGAFGRTEAKLITLDNVLGLDPSDPAGKDDILLLNEIWAPVDAPVHIKLRSKDTIHSLFLPNFRFKQDAVPGMTMEFWFVPTRTGTFEIACSELCGLGHYTMRGLFHVVSKEQFGTWLAGQNPGQ